MKRIFLIILVASFGCSPPSEKSDGPLSVNNTQNNTTQNNSTDAGNNGVTDVSPMFDFGIDEDGPQFVDVAVTPERLTEGGTFEVLVQVTDPQGFEDIGGGRLTNFDGDVFGNFDGAGSSYSITVSWDDLNNIAPIEFTTEETRSFIVEFFDGGGHVSKQGFELTLHCDGSSACDGACGAERCGGECRSDFNNDNENCGSCGNVCSGGQVCSVTDCIDVDYLSTCTNNNQCAGPDTLFTECLNLFDEPVSRCTTFCQDDMNGCGPDALCINAGELVCAQDCSGDPNSCLGDLICLDLGGQSACVPNLGD